MNAYGGGGGLCIVDVKNDIMYVIGNYKVYL